jgi:hypothetical protein
MMCGRGALCHPVFPARLHSGYSRSADLSDRYYIILLPSVLVVIWITVDTLAQPFAAHGLPMAALFAFWCIYPVLALQSYLRKLWSGRPLACNITDSAPSGDKRCRRPRDTSGHQRLWYTATM